jgi:glycosyltransferase involved in cell wall biosynthesis
MSLPVLPALGDVGGALIEKARRRTADQMARLRERGRLARITWFIPYFERAFGGLHTILRFGHLLSQRHRTESHFVIFDRKGIDLQKVKAAVQEIIPGFGGEFSILDEVSSLPPCDLAIATLWPSAYRILEYDQAIAWGYFVQDFEPLFYPGGSNSLLAEETYRLGLYGIFNSRGLYDFVTENYPMRGTWFEPTVDRDVFYATERRERSPTRIFFYARPSSERNGFELGLAALSRLKSELGSKVEILAAGEDWDPADYGARGVVQNLGLLPYKQTGELYRQCDIGLCFMFTKHPSYLPIEMMACGVAVVTNANPANRWLFRHQENCLIASPTSTSVLDQLRRLIDDSGLRRQISTTATQQGNQTTWDEQVDRVYRAIMSR